MEKLRLRDMKLRENGSGSEGWFSEKLEKASKLRFFLPKKVRFLVSKKSGFKGSVLKNLR